MRALKRTYSAGSAFQRITTIARRGTNCNDELQYGIGAANAMVAMYSCDPVDARYCGQMCHSKPHPDLISMAFLPS
jgi:hypothetical protein